MKYLSLNGTFYIHIRRDKLASLTIVASAANNELCDHVSVYCLLFSTTHEFLFGALAELVDNARYNILIWVNKDCLQAIQYVRTIACVSSLVMIKSAFILLACDRQHLFVSK